MNLNRNITWRELAGLLLFGIGTALVYAIEPVRAHVSPPLEVAVLSAAFIPFAVAMTLTGEPRRTGRAQSMLLAVHTIGIAIVTAALYVWVTNTAGGFNKGIWLWVDVLVVWTAWYWLSGTYYKFFRE